MNGSFIQAVIWLYKLFLLWTHAKSLVCNEPSFDVKKDSIKY